MGLLLLALAPLLNRTQVLSGSLHSLVHWVGIALGLGSTFGVGLQQAERGGKGREAARQARLPGQIGSAERERGEGGSEDANPIGRTGRSSGGAAAAPSRQGPGSGARRVVGMPSLGRPVPLPGCVDRRVEGLEGRLTSCRKR